METVNLNNSSVFLGGQTSPPLSITTLRQIEPDTMLVGFDNRVRLFCKIVSFNELDKSLILSQSLV